jgi:hypothetical protein
VGPNGQWQCRPAPRPGWLPWAALSGPCRCPNTPPRCQHHPRLASRAPVPTVPSPVSKADHVAVRAPCLCPSAPPLLSGHLRRRDPLHGERSPEHPPLPPFSPSTLAPKLPPLSHPDAGHRRPPEHPPHRRPPPSSRFFHPSRRQEARVSCRLHPLAQRVASPSWMLERLTLFHLRHSSVTASRVVMRARRAVTAPVCAHASRVVRAGGPRARCAGRGQAGPGHGPRACCAVRGQAGPGGAARTPC